MEVNHQCTSIFIEDCDTDFWQKDTGQHGREKKRKELPHLVT